MKQLLAIFLFFMSHLAFSQVVTSAADAGPGTLREAINNATGGEVITFAPALDGSLIVLNSTLTPLVNMTIDGAGVKIAISGNDNVRIFHLNGAMNVTISNLVLRDGAASIGGAVYAQSGASLTMNNVICRDNHANNDGGALRLFGGSHFLNNVAFIGNSGNAWGGAVYTIFATTVFENCLFAGNQCASGGAAYFKGTTNLSNCTFASNNANSLGGAMYINNGQTITIDNCIFWNNQSTFGIGNSQAFFQIEGGSTAVINIFNSDIEGSGGSGSWNVQYGSDGGGNIDADPNFANQVSPSLAPDVTGNYRPQPTSPVFDAGSNAGNTSVNDLDQHPRIHNGTIDMGCYEFCSTYSSQAITVCDQLISPSGKYTYTFTALYLDTLSNTFGCDSVISIDLTVNNTFSTLNFVACDSFVSVSGLYTYYSSGSYMDTIGNSKGCDSIITQQVVINSAQSSTLTESACYSYLSPGGNVYTSSGTYNDTIAANNGCDSVITINLSINTTYNTISETACDSYSAPSGASYSASGTYNDTIPNTAGCDSVITINLTILNSTSSTISPTACDFYVSSSGANTWTSSGSYSDVITNTAGCDSVITVLLTIDNKTFNSFSEIACESYTTPSGLYTHTVSGIYQDTITNVAGCDSILTIDVTISSTTFSSITEEHCYSYSAPSGAIYNASGTYNDTIANVAGCDSVITIDLTINNETFSSINEVQCESYTAPSGLYTYTTSGIYGDTITNSNGCDSIITIDLTILDKTFSNLNVDECHEFTSPSGNNTWNVSGTYSDTITNSSGCDSIITIELNILENGAILDTSACDTYTSPSGNYVWDSSGDYTDTLTNMNGCDSIITINLNINSVESEILANATSLSSLFVGDNYEWINCDDSSVVSTASDEFIPTETGDYQLVLYSFGCSDTSSCVYFKAAVEMTSAFSPNGDGVNDFLFLEIEDPINKVYIYNRWGDKVAEFENYDNESVYWDGRNLLGNVSEGTFYYVIESSENSVGWVQVVK